MRLAVYFSLLVRRIFAFLPFPPVARQSDGSVDPDRSMKGGLFFLWFCAAVEARSYCDSGLYAFCFHIGGETDPLHSSVGDEVRRRVGVSVLGDDCREGLLEHEGVWDCVWFLLIYTLFFS